MKVLVLNLPHKDKIVRRFMCSYNSPSFLFPPQELMYCASSVKFWNKADVCIVDAIAEGKDLNACMEIVDTGKPDIIVAMTGIECFGSDIEMIRAIKIRRPEAALVVFGYYPSIFPEEVSKATNIDYIIKGEPEICLLELVKTLEAGKKPQRLAGLIFRGAGGEFYDGGRSERISDLDKLPFPDPSMLATNDYKEMLIPGPIALVQSSRGCPFRCNYCITTYGRQLVMRSPENVVAEIELLTRSGYKNIRFTDDTFNVDKERAKAICNLIVEKALKIRWTCLSRIDTLDRGLLALMKKAGCLRIYIGVESFSQKVLDYYNKGYKVSDMLERIGWVREAGIQSTGFLLIGAPIETGEDIALNKQALRKAKLDFAIVTKLTPYPGTPLFEKLKESMDFNLFPYRNLFRQASKEEDMIAVEKELYRAFYYRPGALLSLYKVMAANPAAFFMAGISFLKFLASSERDKEHPDFL